VIAVVLAALAALLTSMYVTNYKRQVRQGEDLEKVYVASQDITAGTTGAEAAKLMKVEEVAKRSLVPGAISDPTQVGNLVVAQTVYAGEQVSTRRFSEASQRGIHGQLKGNARAVQIQGTVNQMLVGTLRPGDKIDVVASFKYKLGGDTYEATRIILRDIEVLKVSGGAAPGSKLTSGLQDRFQVILKLTDAQENKLQFATSFADDDSGDESWTLQLRPPLDDSDSPESVETLGSILRNGLSKSQVARLFGTGNYGG
jgi:pilus assembly protein CpaB